MRTQGGLVGRVTAVLAIAALALVPACDIGVADEPSIDSQSAETRLWRVARVVDGDTVEATRAGRTVTVRVIGIDTPEVHGQTECYGRRASARATRLLAGRRVRLVPDPTQGDEGRYGRKLRYITVGGADFGKSMILAGAAREYTYDDQYRRRQAYRAAQNRAQAAVRGLWAVCSRDE